VIITSGIHCQTYYNSLSDGIPNSKYRLDEAEDISIRGVSDREFCSYIKNLREVSYTFKQNGFGAVHTDVSQSLGLILPAGKAFACGDRFA
jgi:hypothetical protein